MNEQELRELIKTGKIIMESDEIILDDNYITRKEFISSMKKYCNDGKENFSDYRKKSQKSKSKIRKK